ncbi:MAG TPA: hypothetical protein VFT34_12010 [Verrucomicrobiae bacterium]|nr:hypothetical protein [Verrucomicrobiae bacterium]
MKKPYKFPRRLPCLAGICTRKDAMKPGLSVEQCVARLKRFHYAFKRLHEIFVARLTAEPVYELKMAFSLHAYLCAEHATALRRRVGEMREPPLGLEAIPHPGLEIFFDEIRAAPRTAELLLGLYSRAVPALRLGLANHLLDTNPLADHPSVRLCRFARLEVEEMEQFGAKAVSKAVLPAEQQVADDWLKLLDDCLVAAGGLDGREEPGVRPLPRRYSAQPFKFDSVPKRDARFPDPYNMAVNAEVFLYDPAFPPAPKTLMMFYKRLREIDVPEMMASILAQSPGKPWDYYRDMTRQLWDEARHAMMGEVGFASLGIDWAKNVMVNFTWSLALNTQLTPIERHAVLYFIEQGLMPRTGKRFEWETALASHNPLSALFQDYDWADEVLHARIGRDWYLKDFPDAKKAVEYGDHCWSKVLMNWEAWRAEGKTQHRNWWPDLYRAACKTWNIQPDPRVLAYATSYETVRADLKNLSASA